MGETILVIVHPGYAANRNLTADKYGSYEGYLTNLEYASLAYPTILFMFQRDKMRLKLPKDADVVTVRDHDVGYHTKELVSKLREKRPTKVLIGGEFLWYHGGNISENLKLYSQKLPADKRMQFEEALFRTHVLTPTFAKRLCLDVAEFTNEVFYSGNRVVEDACVKTMWRELHGDFNVEIRRDLCYPTVDLPKNR